jgi:hypothetical protein
VPPVQEQITVGSIHLTWRSLRGPPENPGAGLSEITCLGACEGDEGLGPLRTVAPASTEGWSASDL